MQIDAENECPICHSSIMYEPKISSESEKYILNKYLFFYFIKNCWYSFLCFAIVLIRFILNTQLSGYYIYIALLLCISIITSLFQRKFSKFLQWKYSKNFSEYAPSNLSNSIFLSIPPAYPVKLPFFTTTL